MSREGIVAELGMQGVTVQELKYSASHVSVYRGMFYDQIAAIKTPRVGSVANACTEVSTPDRTKNVPKSDSEKAVIANNTVQLLKPPRFSVTASEWSKAVPTSQGMNDAFSTGSQNHQPPQPNS